MIGTYGNLRRLYNKTTSDWPDRYRGSRLGNQHESPPFLCNFCPILLFQLFRIGVLKDYDNSRSTPYSMYSNRKYWILDSPRKFFVLRLFLVQYLPQ